MKTKLACDSVYLDGRMVPAIVAVEDGVIASVEPSRDSGEGCIDLRGYRMIPGLIDSHIHGCAGVDTMDAAYEVFDTMSRYLASCGVTSFLPTTVTAPEEKICRAVSGVADAIERGVSGARILGSYVEGPFLTAEHKGAHPEAYIREIRFEEIERILAAGRGSVKTMLIAPEKPLACEAIRLLRQRGVCVSIGHSSATCEQAEEAIANGAQLVVHIYNGMPPLHHRNPGMVGAALTDAVYTEMICDGFHVAPRAMEIVARCKAPDRVVLITDCMRAGGMPDGEYTLGELRVKVSGGAAHLIDNGSLAGSTLSLNRAVGNYAALSGVCFADAVCAATENPARLLGVYDRIGSLTAGKQADIAVLDGDCRAVFTMVGGRVAVDAR